MSAKAQKIHEQLNQSGIKLGDLRKKAKELKKNHDLAMELWATTGFFSRLLAILIIDKKLLSQSLIDQLTEDMLVHEFDKRTQMADWLLANQLTKDKKLIALMEGWMNSSSSIQKRMFWYYQARLRWTGDLPHTNTASLLAIIDETILNEAEEVQWAMNFTAGWIGIYDEKHREACVALGEKFQLYKNEAVSKGCTPNYLPEFIRIEVDKRAK